MPQDLAVSPPEPKTRLKRRVTRSLLFLAIGLLGSVALAWVLAVCLDMAQGTTQSAGGIERDWTWSVTVTDRTGGMCLASERHAGLSWGPHQATGQPDATPGRDDPKAWASLTQDAQREWLILTYPKPVVPRQIQIHQTYGPGAVDRISVFDETGREHEVWRGHDPPAAGQPSAVSTIPLSTDIRTQRIKIYIDSPNVPGWNEIDAVALVDTQGRTWWALDADASSTYAQQGGAASTYASVWPLVPTWGHIGQPSEPFAKGQIKQEQRMIEAFGWPMLAMWAERDTPQMASATVSPPSNPTLSGTNQKYRVLRPSGQLAPGPSGRAPAMLPLRPIWRGLALDAVFWAVVAWVLLWALVKPRRFVREVSRMRRGCCLQCGYQLNYDFIAGCPECGWRRTGQR